MKTSFWSDQSHQIIQLFYTNVFTRVTIDLHNDDVIMNIYISLGHKLRYIFYIYCTN